MYYGVLTHFSHSGIFFKVSRQLFKWFTRIAAQDRRFHFPLDCIYTQLHTFLNLLISPQIFYGILICNLSNLSTTMILHTILQEEIFLNTEWLLFSAHNDL